MHIGLGEAALQESELIGEQLKKLQEQLAQLGFELMMIKKQSDRTSV